MELILNEEQMLLRSSAQKFFKNRATSKTLRTIFDSDDGYARDDWHAIAQDMGWLGLAVPEAFGGLGLGNAELTVLQQEFGRALYPSPFFAIVALAIPAIVALGSDAQKRALLPSLIAGSALATLAFTNGKGTPFPDGVNVRLTHDGDFLRLSGTAGFVVFGHVADTLLIAARSEEGLSVVVVPRGTPGLDITKLKSSSPVWPIASLRCNDVRVPRDAVLGNIGMAQSALMPVIDRACVALAAEQVGGAEACVAMAVTYAHSRVQFGRAIGSFQAIKHMLADMYTLTETAKSISYYAACVADGQEGRLEEIAPTAKAYCSEAFVRCAADTIQVHGGMGYTWDCDAHFFLKHARASSNFLGDPVWQRERLARALNIV